ncbi:MAG: amidohydrolase [Acidimicrobiia bacterium]|nr:amidohydrolase [Acidimicrobiia bacterium]
MGSPVVDNRYIIISADTHAGGSHAQYREYLDSQYHEDFDAWRGKYKNPFKDLKDDGRIRNWDNDVRRSQQEADGIVGEVIFPNTVPPFFPSFVLFAGQPRPEEYEHRRAGIQAHNRWLVDFVKEDPERRAGIGQIFLNDIDHAIEDATFIKENGLRGGVLLPNIPPDATWMKPVYDPEYDRLWAFLQDNEIPVNIHGGAGAPDYGKYDFSMLLYINEVSFFSQRPFVHMLLGGVFERFPRLKMVMTETGLAWVPPLLKRLDDMIIQIRDTGATGEIRYTDGNKRTMTATEAFQQNFWMGVSQPGPADVAARDVLAPGRFMWGSDYPHDEGTYPFTREHLRQVFEGVAPEEMGQILSGNAADLYGFDLEALAPYAAAVGPTVDELSQPLVELPENPNDALRKGVRQTAA